MANFDEILEELHDNATLTDQAESCVIVDNKRNFIIPEGYDTVLAYSGDVNSQIVTFQIPKFHEGHDLSKCEYKKLKWKNLTSGFEGSSDLIVVTSDNPETENTQILKWNVPPEAFTHAGVLEVSISLYDLSGPEGSEKIAFSWNTPSSTAFSVGLSFQDVNPGLDSYIPAKNEILFINENRQIVAPKGYNGTIVNYGDIGTGKVYFQVKKNFDGIQLDHEATDIKVLIKFNGITISDEIPLSDRKSSFIHTIEQDLIYLIWKLPPELTNNSELFYGPFTISLVFSNGTLKRSTSPFSSLSIGEGLIDDLDEATTRPDFEEAVKDAFMEKSYGFRITEYDSINKVITLYDPDQLLKDIVEFGDQYSIIFENNYDLIGTIEHGDCDFNFSSTLLVPELPDGEKLVEGIDENDTTTVKNVFIIPKKSSVGYVEINPYSHMEGWENKAIGIASHAEGYGTFAVGKYSHTEGRETVAAYSSHAEGRGSQALGVDSHAEGFYAEARGAYSHAEGQNAIASGQGAHSEGVPTGNGTCVIASGRGSHAEGIGSQAEGGGSHAEGGGVKAIKDFSHAEGQYSQADGVASHAEGYQTKTSAVGAHAEGNNTKAVGADSHAEGIGTMAYGPHSHAEGEQTQTGLSPEDLVGKDANYYRSSHAEGLRTYAIKTGSHAEGVDSKSDGLGSHAEGYGTIASVDYQHVEGKYNKQDSNAAHIIGSGTGPADNQRKNIHTVGWNGNAWYSGELRVGGTSYENGSKLATEAYVLSITNGGNGYYSVQEEILGNSETEHSVKYDKDKPFLQYACIVDCGDCTEITVTHTATSRTGADTSEAVVVFEETTHLDPYLIPQTINTTDAYSRQLGGGSESVELSCKMSSNKNPLKIVFLAQ